MTEYTKCALVLLYLAALHSYMHTPKFSEVHRYSYIATLCAYSQILLTV